jgi:type IV secretion system protein VirB5
MASQAKARAGEGNPYLAGRREWNERYGDFIARESRWRMLAMICAATTLFSVGGIAWIGSRSKLVPYLVTVDPSGNALVGHLAQQTPADDNVVRALMAGFIEDWRTVSVDAGSQSRLIDHVYAHLAGGDPALNSINTYYREHNPYQLAAKETMAVTIKSVLRTSAEAIEIEWSEEERDRKGNVRLVSAYKAVATTALNPPTKEEDIMRNPVGFFVKEINWSEEIASP